MNLRSMPALLAGMMLSSPAAFSRDPDFHIYLCLGQSNMEGFPGSIQNQDRTPPGDRFQVLAAVDFPDLERTKGNWYPAVPPLSRPRAGLSPADHFGRTMIAGLPENVRVGVVNVAVAGSRIELFDKDGFKKFAATAPDWMTGIIAAYDGNPYGRLVELGRQAAKDGVIKGILLHQGEANPGDKQWPDKVKRVYENLLKDLDLKAADVPLLAGEVVHADQKGVCAGMNAIIARLPETIPTAHVISSAGCTAMRDRLHFNAAGYRELGKRYAEKMLELQRRKTGDPDRFPAAEP